MQSDASTSPDGHGPTPAHGPVILCLTPDMPNTSFFLQAKARLKFARHYLTECQKCRMPGASESHPTTPPWWRLRWLWLDLYHFDLDRPTLATEYYQRILRESVLVEMRCVVGRLVQGCDDNWLTGSVIHDFINS